MAAPSGGWLRRSLGQATEGDGATNPIRGAIAIAFVFYMRADLLMASIFRSMDIGNTLSITILAIIPLAALTGNAPPDIALVLTILIFFGFRWRQVPVLFGSRFLQLAVIFWIWILICSIMSKFPGHSFQDSLPWIRFPLYAFALSHLLSQQRSHATHIFIGLCVAGTLIEIGFLFREYLNTASEARNVVRLYGTFGKPIPGWYLVCFGLISILALLQKFWDGPTGLIFRFCALTFFILTSVGVFITGEVMNTAFYIGTLLLFFIVRPFKGYKSLGIVVGGFLILLTLFIIVLWGDPALYNRLVIGAMKRLPWMASSDYNLPWTTGIAMAIENVIFGVGPKNFNLYCLSLKEAGTLVTTLHVTECQWHPHNLYLQILAESGVPGLILFAILAGYLFHLAIKASRTSEWRDNIAIILIFALFFPIQTYSQAFGQAKNFFFWTVVGFALARMRLALTSSNPKI